MASTIEKVLPVFKALADESRLKLLGVLAQREASVDEFAAMLMLKAPTVSHHLGRLKEIGIMRWRVDGNTHLYALDHEALRELCKEVLSTERVTAFGPEDGDAWERKVLRDFFDGKRLKEIPASRKKRLVVLRWLCEQFERGERYTEKRLNTILAQHHPDTATLRRELIADEHRLMAREAGVYWRL